MAEGKPEDSQAADEGTHTDHSAPRPVDRAELAAGESLGRYRIIEPLGAGGMGAVYRAHDPDLNRDVAIKVLHAAGQATPPAADHEKRLLREAQALARLSHPNIVTVYDVGTFRGRVFIAMEWVDGHTLKGWLRKAGGSWRERLEVVTAAGRGLAEAHKSGVVHRDFKPDNVLVSRKGQAQVVDFGLARSDGDPELELDGAGAVALRSPDGDALDLQLTRTGAVLGTPAYMSPEQFHGQVATTRSDQFSFAVVAFEALYGTRPFVGVTAQEVMRSVAAGEQLRPPPGDVPSQVLEVLARGMAPAPADRFPDMDAMLAALEEAASATPPRSRMPWVAAALAVVALGLATATYLVTRTDRETETVEPVPGPTPAPPRTPPGPLPPAPIPPEPPPWPKVPGPDDPRFDDWVEETVRRAEEKGEMPDLGRILEDVPDFVREEIRRELRRELDDATNETDRDQAEERIKRRILEQLERGLGQPREPETE